ncbi:MAG: 50S ribosomal protein L4, partial [Alphaproteobacteria bacterium]|nr:50S ribosomal protein L4 [Alphaproteobacteria bacterium]
GLKIALSEKARSGQLIIVDQLTASGKTKELASLFSKNQWNSVLFIDGKVVAENFRRASANIPKINVLPEQGANVYDIIRHDRLVMTRAAVEQLEARLK